MSRPVEGDMVLTQIITDRGAAAVATTAPERIRVALDLLLDAGLGPDCNVEVTFSARLFPVTYRLVAYKPTTLELTLDRVDP